MKHILQSPMLRLTFLGLTTFTVIQACDKTEDPTPLPEPVGDLVGIPYAPQAYTIVKPAYLDICFYLKKIPN